MDRIWPGWTIDDLADLPGFDGKAWEGNLALIHSAQAVGNLYRPWFFRRLVELARSGQAPPSGADKVNWAIAVAGLPPLGEWLSCPECSLLAGLILEHRPWEGGRLADAFARVSQKPPLGLGNRQRLAYIKAARPLADVIRQRIDMVAALSFSSALETNQVIPAPILLAALLERIPVFDRVGRRSPYRRYNLGGLVLGILALPKLNGGG